MNYNKDYDLVEIRRFNLLTWKDRLTFEIPINDDFDSIRLRYIYYLTDTINLLTISLKLLNLDCNLLKYQTDDNQTHNYFYSTILDTRQSIAVYTENISEPIHLHRVHNGLKQLEYEIYINDLSSHSGITSSNRVICAIEFLKKKF